MIGVIAAIGASFSWTTACFIWRIQSKHFHAIEINLIKNLQAVILFMPVLFSFHWDTHIREVLILFIRTFVHSFFLAKGDD